jgi:hypothetical protein
MMHNLKQSIKAHSEELQTDLARSDPDLDTNWLGTRLAVELP